MSGPFRYKAFISYSWKDRAAAERLHHRLETYRTPKALVGAETPRGPVPRRLHPIFKDREEEAAGHNLRHAIETALDNSEFLIVVCSPNANKSQWATKEIAYFRKRRDPRNVIPYIIDGEPHASLIPGREATECFPEALRFETAVDGAASAQPIEAPLGADMRASGDGFRMATLKVAAAMLGVGLDALVRRDAQRRTQRMRIAFSAVSAIAAMMAGLAVFAFDQRNIAREQRAIAETERDTATTALDFLVSIYELANPATENPKTITALTILERGAKKIETDLVKEPEVQAKLLGALGAVYQNLGDSDEAERLLKHALSIPGASVTDRIGAELQLALIDIRRRKLDAIPATLDHIENDIAAASEDGDLNQSQSNDFRLAVAQRRAFFAHLSGKPEEAIGHYTDALALIDPARPDSALIGAAVATNRGMIRVASKNFTEGRADLDRAKSTFIEHFGARHLRTAQATHNIAYAQFEEKDYAAAISTMHDALAIYETVLESNHPDLATARKLYGTMLTAAGRPADAIAPLEAAAKGYEAAYGPTYYDVGYSLVYLAVAYAQAGRADEGLAALEQAELIYKSNFEPGGFDFGDLMVYRAMVLEMAGRPAEAAPLCAEGLEILKANLGPKDPYYLDMAGKCAVTPV